MSAESPTPSVRMAGSWRIAIRGNVIDNRLHVTRCDDCGMGLMDAAEWHPYEACRAFKATHDSREVWRMLARAFIDGRGPRAERMSDVSNGGKERRLLPDSWPHITPLDVLKWTGVLFIIAIEVLVVVSVILAIVEGFS